VNASRLSLLTALCLLAGLPLHAETSRDDLGKVNLYLNDRPIGVEEFSFEVQGDSLVIVANTYQVMPRREDDGRTVALQKQMGIVTTLDYDLINYTSRSVFRGDTIVRGILPAVGDTLYTIYRERNTRGEADRRVLPPGRLFVIDSPPLFSTFNLLCRTLHGRTFDKRPLLLLMLGTRDTVIESTVTDLGTEPIRWGARPVQARKLEFVNERMDFLAWISPAGLLLRLEEPHVGLRAERQPPEIKRPTKRAG
jgi:hypothetical protein